MYIKACSIKKILLAQLVLLFFYEVNAFAQDLSKTSSLPKSIEHSSFYTGDGLGLQILRLGRPDGEPVLAVTGYGSNSLYYLPTALELVKEGKTLYLLAPRGNGAGGLRSQPEENKRHYYHLQNMTEDLHQLIEQIYHLHGKRKLTLMGHSLGGILIRLAELGVRTSKKNYFYLDPRARKLFRERVRAKVLVSSPSPLGQGDLDPEDVEAVLKFLAGIPKAVITKAIFSPVLSVLLELPFAGSALKLGGSWISGLDTQILDPSLVSEREYKDFILHGTSDSIHPDTVGQLYEMIAGKDFLIEDERNSLNLVKLYQDRRVTRVPTLIVGNEKDYLAKVEHLEREYHFLKSMGVPVALLVLPGGHMNSVVGSKNVLKVVEQVIGFESQVKGVERLCKGSLKD